MAMEVVLGMEVVEGRTEVVEVVVIVVFASPNSGMFDGNMIVMCHLKREHCML